MTGYRPVNLMKQNLYNNYPLKIKVGEKYYNIDPDFRLMMHFELYAQKEDKQGIAEIITKFYQYILPVDINAAIHEMISFYLCGETNTDNSDGDDSQKKRCYAYDEDWKYITAAFRQQYGIDLVNSDMHWYEFSALFAGLTEETEFIKILQYRCTDLKKIKNSEEKNRIRRLQKRYALSENKVKHFSSTAERDADMINNLRNNLLKRK